MACTLQGGYSKPNLINRFNDLIGKAGVTGEGNNRIFLFCIASSYKMPDTLHALIQGNYRKRKNPSY
jgi:DNA primase